MRTLRVVVSWFTHDNGQTMTTRDEVLELTRKIIRLEAERDRLRAEQEATTRKIEANDGELNTANATLDSLVAAPAPAPRRAARQTSAEPKRSTIVDRIVAILSAHADSLMESEDVQAKLNADGGGAVDITTVRSTLLRLYQEGRAVRPNRGQYQWAGEPDPRPSDLNGAAHHAQEADA